MQITDIITYIIIAAAVAFFVVREVKAKKGGCSCGCGCNCKDTDCKNCSCGCQDKS